VRPRGFVELTTKGGAPFLVHPEGIVVSMTHKDFSGAPETWVQTRIDGVDYTVRETIDEVASAVSVALGEREGVRLESIRCRRAALEARVAYYQTVNAERLANGCATAYDAPLNEAADALEALAAEAAALIEEDGE
jgi:hypothetical protein